MKNILLKNYTNIEYADFAIQANQNGQRLEQDEIAVYALYPDEVLRNGKIINISQTPEYLAEQLAKAKESKIEENTTARDKKLLGGVEYEGIYFDADADSKINIMFAVSQLTDTSTITWYGINNEALLCNKQDLINIGQAIVTLTSFVWSYKNPEILEAINNAQTIEELNNIVIDYEA